MGIIGLVIMFAPAVGPTVSGLILKSLTWHWIFGFRFRYWLLHSYLGIFYAKYYGTHKTENRHFIDCAINHRFRWNCVWLCSAGEGGGWSSMHVIVAIVVGVIGILVFSLRQLNMKEPMLNLSPFKYPMFVIGLLLILVCMMVMLSAMMILPLYLQTSLALSTFTAGLMLLPGGIINGLLSPIMGGLLINLGRSGVIPGLVIVAATMFGFTNLSVNTSIGYIVTLHITLMIGIAMIMMPAQTNGLNQLPPELYPHGTAIMNTLQQVSGAIGTAVGISILSSGARSFMENVADPANPVNKLLAFTNGVQHAFIFAVIMTVIGLVIAFFIKRVKVEQQVS